MELTLDKEYADYNDETHFLPVLERLTNFYNSYDMQKAQTQSNEEYLNSMEKLEELLRYYTATEKYADLEGIMRKYEPMLNVGKAKGISHPGFSYLLMEYARINALLYANVQKNQKAMQCYEEANQYAFACFQETMKDASLKPGQKKFLLFYIHECIKEFSVAKDRMGLPDEAYRILASGEPVYKALGEYTGEDNLGIVNNLVFIFTDLIGQHFAHDNSTAAETSFNQAITLLESVENLDYFLALKAYVQSLYGTNQAQKQGNMQMLELSKQRAENLIAHGFEEKAIAVAKVVLANYYLMYGTICRLQGKFQDEYANLQMSMNYAESAVDILKQEIDKANLTMKIMLNPMMIRAYVPYIAIVETYSLSAYTIDEHDKARDGFLKVLSLMDNQGQFDIRMGESASKLLRAETMFFLSVIFSEENDADKAVFYASQSVDLCYDSGNMQLYGIGIKSAAMNAEMLLILKDKKTALEYAEKGLAMCNALAQVNPGAQELEFASALEKAKKKASKKWFF